MQKFNPRYRKPSFYWYDTETTGLRITYDRIIQFAGQRTDLDLEPIGEPLNDYLRLPPDVVPSAESFKITKIRPTVLAEQGISEFQFFCKLRRELMQQNTCIIGYNNIGFDDNFLRFGMYRNLLPVYEHEHKRGNTRLDFLSIVRFTGALRPEGLEWPVVDGVPSFSLDKLAAANGIATDDAHDALVDVNMTLALARKIKAAQPKLWKYAYTLRKKNTSRDLFDPETRQSVLHVSPKYGNARYCIAPVLPIARHPKIYTRIIVVDLCCNIDLLLSSSSDEIANLLFERQDQDTDTDTDTEKEVKPEESLNINVVAINQAPMVAKLETLLPENIKRLNIDPDIVEKNKQRLLAAADLPKKLRAVFVGRKQNQEKTAKIAEESLYDGFISREDQLECVNFWNELKSGKSWPNLRVEDARLRDIHTRLKAKIAPQELTNSEQQSYHRFVQQQLVREDRNLFEVQKSTNELLQQELSAEQTVVLQELQAHLEQLASQYDVERPD